MNKELEVIDWLLVNEMIYRGRTRLPISSELNGIKHSLQRLESIDNANPSEALECLKELDNMQFSRSVDTYVPEIKSEISETQYLDNTTEFYTIKQALIKAQEQEKVLEIMKDKWVNVAVLIHSKTSEEYNNNAYTPYNLTQEEFDLLKRWLG